jgi:hypothetical protein
MIIVVDTEGQLCNRLWGFLPLLHHQQLTGERVWVLFFDEYMAFFPSLSGSRALKCLRFLPKGTLYQKTRTAFRRLLRNERFTYNRPLNQHTRSCSLVIAWEHREEPHDEATREMAVGLFRPTDSVLARVNQTLFSVRTQGNVVLGVHMRKRDYRDFFGGRYFYSDAEYRSFMIQIKEQVEALGFSLTCLLCSDEPIDLSAFQDLDVHYIPQTTPLVDLYALSGCDFIVGPPSTFSQWASYYGLTPLLLVWDKIKPLRLTDFGIITKLDHVKPVDMPAWLRERSASHLAPTN